MRAAQHGEGLEMQARFRLGLRAWGSAADMRADPPSQSKVGDTTGLDVLARAARRRPGGLTAE